MVKMTQKFSRQEAVLRRRAEQAGAAYKRLKEISDRKKAAQANKTAGAHVPMKERLTKWISDDVEIEVNFLGIL